MILVQFMNEDRISTLTVESIKFGYSNDTFLSNNKEKAYNHCMLFNCIYKQVNIYQLI